MKLLHIKSSIDFRYILFVALISVLSFSSCTDLGEEVLDEIVSGDIKSVEDSGEKLLSGTYSKNKDIFCSYHGIWCVQELSTDEAVLPTRGEDWGDGGSWRALHEFTWNENSSRPNNLWSTLSGAVAQALTAIDVLKDDDGEYAKMYLAEAKALLALYTYQIADIYGQVPYRDPDNPDFAALPEVLTAAEAVNVCIETINACLPDLAEIGKNGTYFGRFTKQAAYSLLAEIYLNKAVYEDRYNETSDFNFVESHYMDSVIYYSDKLISNPHFALEDDYFEIFGVDNYQNSEHIFSIVQEATGSNPGNNHFTYLSMGRNQKSNPDNNRGSNASCATPDYYSTWDNNREDPRFQKHTIKNGGVPFKNDGSDFSLPYDGTFHFNRGFQEGQQYGPIISDGEFEMDPDDNSRVLVQKLYTEKNTDLLMDFTRELDFDDPGKAIFTQNQINRGVRVFKQEYDAENTRKYGGVDIPVFRLGGIYTMRAEAKFRNGDVSGALDDINTLRSSRWSIAMDGSKYYGKNISSLDEETLYNEISYELYWESKRRPQMIRFGKFEDVYTAKPASEPYRRVFAIPQSELDVNKDLVQNKGY
jgi:hypothetical protein